MPRGLKEPIPVGPFLAWCERREAQIKRELDMWPEVRRDEPASAMSNVEREARGVLLAEIGWTGKHDARRLYRWRHETINGMVERAVVEDALDHAGVGFYVVYPDAPVPTGNGGRYGVGRKMTEAQIVAAHTLHCRGKLTTQQVAALVADRYGYASVEAADVSLRAAWRSMGLPLRKCGATTRRGGRCGKSPMSGRDRCREHSGCGWELPTCLLEQAREMHEQDSLPFVAIAVALLDQTPYSSSKWLATQLAAVAAREGWHRTHRIGQRRRRTYVRYSPDLEAAVREGGWYFARPELDGAAV